MKYLKEYNEYTEKETKRHYKDVLIDELIRVDNSDDLLNFLETYDFCEQFDSVFDHDDYDEFEIIGAGSFGLVVKFKNFIFKLTFEKNTYLLARKVLNKHYKHIVDILDIIVIHNRHSSMYIIKMNECKPLTPDLRYFFVKESLRNMILRINEIDNFLDFPDERIYNYLHEINLKQQIIELRNELKDSGLIKYELDLNIGNIMMKNNEICIIDFIYPK